MNEVIITIGPTRVKVILNGKGKRLYGDLWKFCKSKLTTFTWIPRMKRYKLDKKYYIYDEDNKCFYFPINYISLINEFFASHDTKPFKEIEETYTTRNISGDINPDFVLRDYQEKAITYINDDKSSRKGLSLQTGKGKTFSATAAVLDRGFATLIIASGLTKQWVRALYEQTLIIQNIGCNDEYYNLLEEEIPLDKFIKQSNEMVGSEIFIIQGIKSLKELVDSKVRPKFIFASLETMRSYVKGNGNYENILSYQDFLKYYGIGTRVVDEAHLNFHANVMMDLSGNIPLNIYLTATFDTADVSLKKIFNTIYPDDMRYGSENYDRYAATAFYGFNGNVPEKRCVTGQGYSHSRYEGWLLKNDHLRIDWYNRIIVPLVMAHWINSDHSDKKLLIFCKTIAMVDDMIDMLKSHIEDKVILSYVSRDPESNLEDGDIIVSTHGSAGTGKDIDNLFCVINTVSFKAPTTTRQIFGRLRKMKCGSTPSYVDIVDLNLRSHVRHWRKRAEILKSCSLSYKEFKIP